MTPYRSCSTRRYAEENEESVLEKALKWGKVSFTFLTSLVALTFELYKSSLMSLSKFSQNFLMNPAGSRSVSSKFLWVEGNVLHSRLRKDQEEEGGHEEEKKLKEGQ